MIPSDVYTRAIGDFLAPIASYLRDPNVTEVMINGPEQIYVERRGKLTCIPERIGIRALHSVIRSIAQFQGVHVDEKHPILEAHLPDGSRVEAILPPAGNGGPHLAIRRFSKDTLSVERLIKYGALTEDAATALRALSDAKQNIIVAGGTGSGKTSMLNALSSFIPADQRVVVIEDARELQLQLPHVVHLEAQKPDAQGEGAVGIAELFKATLRMRPDRIVIGELRGAEALDLIQAMTSGHGGCMSTVHATYPTDTLRRIETMAMMNDVRLPLPALRSQIASAVDIIVQTARMKDGSRGVTHISEVVGLDSDGDYRIADLFERSATTEDAKAELRPTGVLPHCTPAIQALGMPLPWKQAFTASEHTK